VGEHRRTVGSYKWWRFVALFE